MKPGIAIFIIAAALCILLRDPLLMAGVLFLALIAVIIVDIIEKRRSEKQIKELISYITKVQDYTSLPEMQKISEGSIGILQSEIYKVITILREQYASEHDQKKYMSDMMSDISHQFKTPLTAISLMCELLMNEEVSDEQRLEYAGKIDSQINKMTWLIKNLLTLSQLEAGVLEMKTEAVSLKALLDDLADPLIVLAEVAEVDLKCSIPETIQIRADKHWFREAVSNIVKNCIEHTAAGGCVKIYASQNNIYTSLIIEDNGKGIEKEHLPHIFERFYKADNASVNSVGIGLAMAKQIINLHNGRIEAESEAGKGSKFIITLYDRYENGVF